MNRTRYALVLAGIAVAVGLFVLLRPSDDDDESVTGARTTEALPLPTTGAAATTKPPDTPAATTATARPEHAEVIRIQNGKVVGGLRSIEVEKGTHVTLVITSDVEDEVHVHGIDKSALLEPGVARSIKFVAKIAGRFEIELEQRGAQIADLKVTP